MNTKIALLISLFVISSNVWSYVPPITNSSLVNSKGEFQAAITYGSAGAEQYFAYAIDKDLFLCLNSSFTLDTVFNGSDKRSHYFFEGGFGYSMNAGSWVFTMGGTYGYGQFYTRYFDLTPEPNYMVYQDLQFPADVHKFSIQADIGIKKPFFELAFTHRFAVGYFSLKSSEYRLKNSTTSFYEPAITLKAGPGKVKFFTQARLSLPLNSRSYDMSYGAISIGLILHLGKKDTEESYSID